MIIIIEYNFLYYRLLTRKMDSFGGMIFNWG